MAENEENPLDEGLELNEYEGGGAVLHFEEIFPTKRPYFELQDGQHIDFLVLQDLEGAEFAQISRFQKLFMANLDRMEKKPEDEAVQKRLGTITRDFVKVILPDIDSVLAGKMTLGQKVNIINFWNSEAGFGAGDEKKDDGDRSRRT